jgi:hypothetical protein
LYPTILSLGVGLGWRSFLKGVIVELELELEQAHCVTSFV